MDTIHKQVKHHICGRGAMDMYEKGEYIVCRSGGLWLVSQNDNSKLLLVKHECGTSKILPMDSEEIVRKIISKEAILEVIGRIPFIRTIRASNDKIRKALYEEAMKQYDEIEWVKIIKSVYLWQQEKRIAPSEIAFSDKAKGYLHGEISILLEIPLDEVEEYITSTISSETW